MARDDQADAASFGLDRAVKPRLAGEQHICAGARGVLQEVIAGAAGDSHAQDQALRIAHEADRSPTQLAACERCELAQGLCLRKAPDSAHSDGQIC